MSEESVFAPVADAAAEAVSEGVSVRIAGPPGSGRSALLELIAGRLENDGRGVLRLYASPAWRGEPYAALSAAGVGPANAPGPRRSAGEMSAALAQRLGGARTVVTVDDADELDDPSAGALASARRRHDVVMITTSRPRCPGGDRPPPAGPAIRLRPPVLGLDQVHAVSRRILGGPLSPDALARITMKSGGLFGLVNAIVSAGRGSGALRERNGIWTMPGGAWSDELGPAVQPFLAGAGPEAADAATALAVAGPLPLEEAERLVGRAALRGLFALGLAHEAREAGAGIYPPLLADYLRAEGPPLARARAAAPPAGEPPAAKPLAAKPLAGEPPAETTPAGADAAVRNQRAVREAAGEVIRLTGDWEAGPAPATAMPLLVAMRAAGVPARQVEQVMAATPGDDSFATARLHSWYATWQAADRGELGAALKTLDQIAERIPAHTDFFEVTRAHVVFLRDRVPDTARLRDGPDAELLRVLRAELLLATGKAERARRALRGFRPRGRVASGQASLLNALGAVLAGDLAEGADQAYRGLPGARGTGDPGLVQAHAYTAGLALCVSGRLADGAEVLSGALSAATVASYRDPYHSGVLVLGGVIALARGRLEYARALAAQAEAADAGGYGPYPAMDHRALTALLTEDADLWPLVEDRLSRGYVASALFLASEAVEREGNPPSEARGGFPRASPGGPGGRAAPLSRGFEKGAKPPLGGTEGRLLPALAGYVTAAVEGDEAGLGAAAEDLAGTGAGLYAVRAEVTRCLALRRAGRGQEAADLAGEAWERSAVAVPDRAALFSRLRRDAGLSQREEEILALAAGRRTTAEIAGALTMSRRTVETHLHNIGRKAGVRGRAGLVRAGTTWLRASQPLRRCGKLPGGALRSVNRPL